MRPENQQDKAIRRPIQAGAKPLFGGLVASAHMANDAVTSMLPALFPLLASQFQLTPSELAVLASVFAISTALPQPFFGSLADRFGGHRLGAIGLGVTGVLVTSLGFVSSVPWLCVLLVIGGLGSAALHPAGLGLSRASSVTNPGLAVALFDAAGMAGGALGPVLAIGITSYLGLLGLVWAAVPALLIAALLFWFGPRVQVVAPSEGSPSRASLGLRGPVGLLALVALFANVVMMTFTSAVPMWLVTERGLAPSSSVIGWTLATFSTAAAAGGILGGTLTRWFRARNLVVGSLGLSLVALESVLALPPGSLPYFVAVGAAGALVHLHAPIVMTRAQELSPRAGSAVAGILLGGTWAGAGLIYAGLGPMQAALGIGGTMAAAFFVVLPAARIAAGVLSTQSDGPEIDDRPCCAMDLCLTAVNAS